MPSFRFGAFQRCDVSTPCDEDVDDHRLKVRRSESKGIIILGVKVSAPVEEQVNHRRVTVLRGHPKGKVVPGVNIGTPVEEKTRHFQLPVHRRPMKGAVVISVDVHPSIEKELDHFPVTIPNHFSQGTVGRPNISPPGEKEADHLEVILIDGDEKRIVLIVTRISPSVKKELGQFPMIMFGGITQCPVVLGVNIRSRVEEKMDHG